LKTPSQFVGVFKSKIGNRKSQIGDGPSEFPPAARGVGRFRK
jgi:hypothetical protein